MTGPEKEHWLARPASIRWLWAVFIVVLVALLALDLVAHHHSYFGLDGTFGFGAWYGFLACVVLIAFAKALGAALKRPDAYYDE